MPDHKQVVTSQGITCDEKIAPLIELLNSRGFETDFSCQGYPAGREGYTGQNDPFCQAYISLLRMTDLPPILDTLGTTWSSRWWHYEPHYNIRDRSYSGITIRFPADDIQLFLSEMERHA